MNCRWCQSERETELSPTVIAQVLPVVCHWAVGTSDASPRCSAVRYQKEQVTTLSALKTAWSNAVPIIITCQCSNQCIKNQDNVQLSFYLIQMQTFFELHSKNLWANSETIADKMQMYQALWFHLLVLLGTQTRCLCAASNTEFCRSSRLSNNSSVPIKRMNQQSADTICINTLF